MQISMDCSNAQDTMEDIMGGVSIYNKEEWNTKEWKENFIESSKTRKDQESLHQRVCGIEEDEFRAFKGGREKKGNKKGEMKGISYAPNHLWQK